MTKILDFLKGKKTFIVGILMVVLGFLNHDNQQVLEGIGFITLRLGMK